VRRYYRLTGDGAAQLAAEVDRPRERAEAAATRLAIPSRLDGAFTSWPRVSREDLNA
jgi:hypothetical protein